MSNAAGKVGTKAGMKIISHTDDIADVAKGFGKLDDVSDTVKVLDKLEDAPDIVKYGDDLIEGASGVGNPVDDIINGVEKGDIKLTNNIQKGNYGEMKMDSYFEQQGYKRLSMDKVTDINAPTHQGIDGVYYNPNGKPPYVIGEAKYGTSQLGKTLDGKQMSNTWIEGSDRLVNAVGKDLADDILLEGYGKTVVRIKPDGTVVSKILE